MTAFMQREQARYGSIIPQRRHQNRVMQKPCQLSCVACLLVLPEDIVIVKPSERALISIRWLLMSLLLEVALRGMLLGALFKRPR